MQAAEVEQSLPVADRLPGRYGPGSVASLTCKRLTPALLWWEKLPAGGAFSNGACQPFWFSTSRQVG